MSSSAASSSDNGAPAPLADDRTLEALDFAGVRERVVAATRTACGKSHAEQLAPLADYDAVIVQQARTSAVRELVAGADLHVLPAIDTADLTQGAVLGRTLAASELRAIGEAIAAAAAAHQAIRDRAELRSVVAAYTPLREMQRALIDAIDERGTVLDRASPSLGRLRRSLSQAQADARDRIGAILKSPKYANAIQDNVVTIREGRFVIPVKSEFSGTLPGIVHDTSSSGQTLFVEPLAALETNNRVRTLRIEEEREVQRILEELSRRVGSVGGAIEANVEMLATVDLLVAKAQVAQAMDAVAPELSEEPRIRIERGRHPLLGARAVPQSLELDDATRLLVISGPNMGGKSVALKMIGLMVVMTYCGLQVPAASGTVIGCFKCVVCDIGDEQSIVANTSTFSAHLQRMREMLERAGGRTLVLIDEIGGGTEPTAGAALAVAMLECLLERGARGVVTTHATELKLFAHSAPGVQNASVRFEPETFAPTFELDVGAPGQSLAFPLARTLGIEDAIVENAQHLLDSRERDYETALGELSARSAEMQTQLQRLQGEHRDLARQEGSLERERATFEDERRTFAARADERLEQALRDFVRELEVRATRQGTQRSRNPKPTPAQAALLSQTIEAMHRDLGIAAKAAPSVDVGNFVPGDSIEVTTLAQTGNVIEDYGDTVLVAVGPMRTVVSKGDVRRAPMARRKLPTGDALARTQTSSNASTELDVRGKRYAEAEPLVERWIDAAVAAQSPRLRLIHGKGTGMLGRGLHEYLRTHPAVKSFRYGNEDEGSTGVTIVELT
ncbi:MAG: Smr/MutS family protein [Candidatus Eremiobacteraeota bacterium]|nr:Smr/MutS family protein [Candidatus Eremiobacteraeota bacterium]